MTERTSWGVAVGRGVGIATGLVAIGVALAGLVSAGRYVLERFGVTGQLEIVAVVSVTAAVVVMMATSVWQYQLRG